MERKFFKVVLPVVFSTDESLMFDKEVNDQKEMMDKAYISDEDVSDSLELSVVRDGIFYSVDYIGPYSQNDRLFSGFCLVSSGDKEYTVKMSIQEVEDIIDQEKQRLATL